MKIKEYEFGNGRPVVCVPVVESSEDKIIEMIQQMTSQKVPMIEWRMDWYEKVEEQEAMSELLQKIAPYVEDTVFLCTFRSSRQGGERVMEENTYIALNQLVAESGVADMVDLEFYEISQPDKVIKQLQEKGVYVVCSNHNFECTPELSEMEKQLSEMAEAGADFSKLAVMPQGKVDVLHLMEAVIKVKEKYQDRHFIAMSMTKEGMISRLLGQWYFSEITFAAFGKTSAPGQVDYRQIQEILEQIEECGR